MDNLCISDDSSREAMGDIPLTGGLIWYSLSYIVRAISRVILACAIFLLFSPALFALSPEEAMSCPAAAWRAWTPREQAIYFLGVIHGEIDLAIRLARAGLPLEILAPYLANDDSLEDQAAKMTQHLSEAQPPDYELLTALMAVRWDIYPNTITPIQDPE